MKTRPSNEELFWRRVPDRPEEPDKCWTHNGSKGSHGYPQATSANRAVSTLAHRRSWELSVGPIPDGMFILHKCDNKECVRPSHLYLGTHTQNMLDIVTRKRRVGKGHMGSRKLTNDQAAMVKDSDRPAHELASELGVSSDIINNIRSGRSYRGGIRERMTDEQRALVYDLTVSGFEAARRTGLDIKTVYNHRRKARASAP